MTQQSPEPMHEQMERMAAQFEQLCSMPESQDEIEAAFPAIQGTCANCLVTGPARNTRWWAGDEANLCFECFNEVAAALKALLARDYEKFLSVRQRFYFRTFEWNPTWKVRPN